ncbi:MAG TPA: hypothetical protein VHE32_08940 [Rhodanobacteraceae bacterium]|nr:hypothetical protein [Rhodanobacteraceae bacterium]
MTSDKESFMPACTRSLLFALAIAVLGGCSGGQAPASSAAPAATAPVANPQAAKSLAMYRELLQSKSYELAAPIGQELVAKYPASPEAKEVGETLADTVAKAGAIAARRRLERLWIYQSGKESGGEQTTASIYSSRPGGDDRVRLILRRHSAWGRSAYLFASGKGFECPRACTIGVRFDDAPPQRMKAHLPETGEPAIFISDDRSFIAKMNKAQKIAFDVVLKGKGAQTLEFEVGGYDADKFPAPAKK